MMRCNYSKGHHCEQGFTYLWTLALIAMLAIGSGVGADLYSTMARRDSEVELIFIGHEFRNAIERYHAVQTSGMGHEYPTSLEQLLQDDRFPDRRRYLRKIYLDPMTKEAEWGLIRIAGRIVGVHSLSEREPIKQKNFEPIDLEFEGRDKYSDWKFIYHSQQLGKDGQISESGVAESMGSAK